MFSGILEFSQTFMSSLHDFASSILNFLGFEFEILGTTYSLFSLLFSSAVVLVITYGIYKFILDIFG